jgi:mannitol/fructose-specific phosphotransferase system IIA component (Ntr-type)
LRDLDERAVAVRARATGWRDAVDLCGRLLLGRGMVRESYVRAMVRTVEDLGPYAVIAPGVAIPHARPEDGALSEGISVVTLREPVEFGSEENDPVDLLFGFATRGTEAHMDLIQDLAEFIGEEKNLDGLRRARTPAEALAVLEVGKPAG